VAIIATNITITFSIANNIAVLTFQLLTR